MKFDLGITPLIIIKSHNSFTISLLSIRFTIKRTTHQLGFGVNISRVQCADRVKTILKLFFYGLSASFCIGEQLDNIYLKCSGCGSIMNPCEGFECDCWLDDDSDWVYVFRKPWLYCDDIIEKMELGEYIEEDLEWLGLVRE